MTGHAGNHMTQEDVAWTEPKPAPAVSDPPARVGVDTAAVAMLVGGIMYAVGSALPWITATAAFVGTISRSGLEGGDGLITIVIGLLIAGVGLLGLTGSRRAGSKAAQVILSGIALAFAVWEITNVNSRIEDLQSGEISAFASVGIGLWVMVIGGGVALFGALSRKG